MHQRRKTRRTTQTLHAPLSPKAAEQKVQELQKIVNDTYKVQVLDGPFMSELRAGKLPKKTIQGGGRIVNIASQAGLSYSVWQGPHYHAAKAGIIHLTTVMAMELGPYNIRVNAVAPGFTESPSSAPLLPTPHPREIVLSQIPLGRLGTADDVVQAVLFLASDRSAYITGQTVVVNGGSPGFSRDPRER